MQYNRNEIEFKRGQFRVRGDVIEIFPAYEAEFAIRIEFFGDEIERLELIHPVSGNTLASEQKVFVFPAVHYVLPQDQLQEALSNIRSECSRRVAQLKKEGKLLESQRLQARTRYDVEMLSEVGYCPGVENYARHLEGRPPGSRPFTLLDYFHHVPEFKPDDWLVARSMNPHRHDSPDSAGCTAATSARRKTLVESRLAAALVALDNRPLTLRGVGGDRATHAPATCLGDASGL